jgi:hypothetical protein
MEDNIEVVYNHEKRRLTIKKDGDVVGGFCGKIATRMMEKIAMQNEKITIEDGNVQVGVQ